MRASRHAFLVLGCIGGAVLAACGPHGFGERGDGGGGDATPDADARDGDASPFELIPSESYGPGVTASDAMIFKSAPGSAAPFVFDPPSGVVLPGGWPSPEMLTHTTETPWLVRLELDYGGSSVAAFTAFPTPAPHSDPQTNEPWWTIKFPSDVFTKIKAAVGDGELKWRVLYASSGASAPDGAQHGTMRFLTGADQPDVTYWEIIAALDAYSVQRNKVGASATATLVPSNGQSCRYGCHTTTPDGQDLALNVWDEPNQIARRVGVVRPQVNAPPVRSPIVSASAGALLDSISLLIPTVSAGAWSATSGRWVAAAYTANDGAVEGPFQLGVVRVDAANATLNLLSPSSDVGGSDVLPAWAPDASRIVFVHTTVAADGYVPPQSYAPSSDLYSVSVTLGANGGATFGAPSPMPFVSGTKEIETYPGFSPDGALLTYMRAAPGTGGYDETTGDVYVMKSDGSAAPIRIAADDAPTDASVYAGAGLTNSWPRFGRQVVTTSEGNYYQLVFSSRRGSSTMWHDEVRGNGRPFARLVYTVVLVKPNGTVETFPGAIIPGQRVDAGSHCPDYTTVTSVPAPGPN